MTRHARQRAAERFGVAANEADISQLLLDVQQGRAVLMARMPDGQTHWLVNLAGKPVRAILNRAADCVLTVLPLVKMRSTIRSKYAQRRGGIYGRPEPRRQRGINGEDLD